jgi:hypothetical protein
MGKCCSRGSSFGSLDRSPEPFPSTWFQRGWIAAFTYFLLRSALFQTLNDGSIHRHDRAALFENCKVLFVVRVMGQIISVLLVTCQGRQLNRTERLVGRARKICPRKMLRGLPPASSNGILAARSIIGERSFCFYSFIKFRVIVERSHYPHCCMGD